MFIEVCAVGAIAASFGWVYTRRSRREYFEMFRRARLFCRRGEILGAEKKAILENISEGVVTCDKEGRITYLNGRAQGFLSLHNSSILSRKIGEVFATTESEIFQEIGKLIVQMQTCGERVSVHLVKFHLEVVALPAMDDRGICLIIKDLSNHQKIVEMGKEFIANASHELRTPITIIRGFAETLLDLREISEEMFESIMNKIIRNCERMQVLVKNLLTLADLDSTGVQMKECELISMVDAVCYTLLSVSPDAHIEQLHNEDQVKIWADSSLLELALFNLLKNAVKYSEGSAQIKITVIGSEETVEIQVEDRGIGMKESELQKIFERFYTVDKSHSRQMGGAGLGLSIVKTIIDQHHGKVWASSKFGIGTTFYIVLPRL